MRVLATYSIKGGVGKTSTAVNLAFEAARTGARTLLWDLDPQGAATFFLRVEQRLKGGAERLVGAEGELGRHVRATDYAGLHLVPADFSLRHLDLHLDAGRKPVQRLGALLGPLRDRYDVALLDCPPSISLSSESVFGAADALLVPVIPTTLSTRTLDQLTAFLAEFGGRRAPDVLPHLSMVDRRKRMQRELAGSLPASWPGFLAAGIPNASVVERMGEERAPVATFAPAHPVVAAYRRLWSEVAARLWR